MPYYIPLPNELHKPWVWPRRPAGKHVLCEKPLAGIDAAKAQEMVDGCRKHGVILHEAFMWRRTNRAYPARRLLAGGQLGELRLVKMDFSFDIDRTDWRLDPKRGGGRPLRPGLLRHQRRPLFTGADPSRFSAAGHSTRRGSI